MKKVILFALLSAVTSALSAAHAQSYPPLQSHSYTCTYSNPTFGESSPGTSIFSFVYLNTSTQMSGIESFDTIHHYQDNRKVTFAKPVDRYRATDWEFTINPSGPQCNARVSNDGFTITFSGCTDGSSRYCN
jgi:hypothetical protein